MFIVDDWPDFLKPVMPAPVATVPKQPIMNNNSNSQDITPAVSCITYNRVSWTLHIRKEVFSPSEALTPPTALQLIFLQIAKDVLGVTPCIRLSEADKRAAAAILQGYGVTADTLDGQHRAHVKKHLIEMARSWPLYFSRLFIASASPPVSNLTCIWKVSVLIEGFCSS